MNWLIHELWYTVAGEAGWTPDQWGHTRFKLFNGSADMVTNQKQLNALMRALLKVVINLFCFVINYYVLLHIMLLQLHAL
jgi:hypothetical protein